MGKMKTCYANETPPYYYNVTYIVNETREKLISSFECEYSAWKFVNKLKHSKKCTLVSYPLFS